MDKRKIIISASIIGTVTVALTATLLIINFSNQSKDILYGNFNQTVVMSDNLNYIIDDNFDKYTIDIIEKGLNDFFIPLYPQGVGIEFISYNATDERYSIRIVDSYGKFHTLTIQYNPDDMSTTIIIDDSFKNDYLPNIPNRDEDE